METSDVRSIDSLRLLRIAIGNLGHDWDLALQQIRFAMHRIAEHFSSTMPAHWKQQTRIADRKLAEARDNFSRQQSTSSDTKAPGLTEAKRRVQLAQRRLTMCEEKLRLAAKIAIQVERACQELAGPMAEVAGHVDTTLPNAAVHLAELIGHLERYALNGTDSQP